MRKVLLGSCLLVLTVVSGCTSGPKMVYVRGKITNGGKSLVSDHKGGLTLVFLPIPATGHTYPAGFNVQDDTYEVPGRGPNFKGIPQGKYKVYFAITMENMTPEADKLNTKFSEKNSPIEVEVTEPALDIDVSKFVPK